MAAAKKPTSIYAVIGTDEGRVAETALALARKFAPPDDDFGLEVISGQADNSDHVTQIIRSTIESIQTLPFFGGDKVVWLQGANFLGDSVTGRSETTLDAVSALQEILEAGLPPGVTFILSASEIDKRRSFYKKLGSIATVEIHDRIDINKDDWQGQVATMVSGWARELGLSFDGEAIDEFVQRVGVDTRQLRNELEKLSLYLGDRRRATLADVEAIIAATHTGVVFEIGRSLAQRDLPRTIHLIEQQLGKGEQAVGLLLAAIVPTVRNLLQARDLRERHNISGSQNYRGFEGAVNRLPAHETAHLPKKKEGGVNVWGLYLAAQQCGKFAAAELRDALEACLEANLRLVTTGLEPRLVLSQLVTRILARQPKQARNRAA
ncbi:MAG: DNA polymerase III subunit delta [Verrucomicrobiales bacterium]|nr:DNA polymerase III subunit delta [Verrucomicrobiales bacterium]